MTTAQVLNPGLHFKTRAALQLDTSWSELERAIVLTVAYADVFDYPLTSGEIHRYLAGVAAAPAAVAAALGQLSGRALAQSGPYVMLPGRHPGQVAVDLAAGQRIVEHVGVGHR